MTADRIPSSRPLAASEAAALRGAVDAVIAERERRFPWTKRRTTERFTAGDLRAVIDGLPEDTPLFIRGHLGGLYDLSSPEEEEIVLDVGQAENGYGVHDYADDFAPPPASSAPTTRVIGWVFG